MLRFVMIRVCCIVATRSHYSVSVQKRGEKHPFLSVHIDPSDNKYGFLWISAFVRSHCSGSVKLIVEYWSVFKNLRFCGYPLSIAFSKTSVFVAFLCRSMRTPPFCTKTVQFERDLN